jgi:hypothetical protein
MSSRNGTVLKEFELGAVRLEDGFDLKIQLADRPQYSV